MHKYCIKTHQTMVILGKISALTLAIFMSHHAMAQSSTDELPELPSIEIAVEQENRYEDGKKEQFKENIVSIYKEKEEVERYKGVNPADLLSGVAGVHSSDSRNNGAISPNIRGLQGEGRIPVVVDGTRSEYTVYRGYAGVNNRTYVDPNLISEVRAYKGATELNHGMPLAVGGAVMLNTIDAKDVLSDDKNWGVSVKYETNNNSVKPRYPNINYGERFDYGENFWTLFGDANPHLYVPLKNSGKNKLFDDYAFRFAVAGKNDLSDVMLAYSKREQGNYFSGSRNASSYVNKFAETDSVGDDDVVNFAEIMPPSYEVPNTASSNETWLFKNNWYLPQGQEINLSWRKSDLAYGEVMNTRSAYSEIIKNVFDYGANTTIGTQWTPAKVKQHAGRIDYQLNPENNDWLNLKTSAWYSKTTSQNNSSGAPIALPRGSDSQYEMIFAKMLLDSGCLKSDGYVLQTTAFDLSCKISQAQLNEVRQKYKTEMGHDLNARIAEIINPALHLVRNKQYGFDLSNTFQLRENVSLTLGYNLHRQKQTAFMEKRPQSCPSGYDADGHCEFSYDVSSYIFPPKAGERDEHNLWAHLNWQATDKLNIQLGGRWGKANLEDTFLHEKVATGEWKKPVVIDYIPYSVQYKPTDEENETLFDTWAISNQLGIWDIDDDERNAKIAERDAFIEKNIEDYKAKYGYKGTFEENGVLHFYREEYKWYADKHGHLPAETAPYTQPVQREGEYIGGGVTEKLTTYKPAGLGERQFKSEFDPSISISYAFTPYHRVYARYNQVTRIPSMYEGLSGFSQNPYKIDANSSDELVMDYLEPEVAKNLELGYVQDLTYWLPNWKNADVKLNYYRNRIHNVLDRTESALSNFYTQYERLDTQGVELQGRMDTGKIFADLSYSYLMKSEMCDSRAQIKLGSFYSYQPDIRTCFTGGFPNGYLRGAIPPKHSVSLSLGSRFLDDRLVLGSRVSYQSNANVKKVRDEMDWRWQEEGINRTTGTYVWKSYYTVDAYMDYKPMPNLKLSLIGTNLTNQYHPDALTRTVFPAPGRTFKLGIDYKF